MERSRFHIMAGALAAALSLSALTGCSGIADVPGEVGGLFQSIVKDVTDPVSVAEARAARHDSLMAAVSDEDLVTPGTLTVGLQVTGTAPLVIAGSDGEYGGIDVETAYALADQLGLGAVEFVPVQSVAEGVETCDVVMGASSEEPDCAVVGSYVQSALGVFSATDVASVPISAADLGGATIGVQAGSVSQASLGRLNLGNAEQTFSNLNEAFDALAAGTVDYVVCDAYSGAYLAHAYDGVSFAGTIDAPLPVGIAVAPDASSLIGNVQMALDEIQTNGVAAIGRARWVGDFPALTEATVVSGLPDPQEQEQGEQDDQAADDEGEASSDGESEDGALIGTSVADDGTDESGDLLAP